MGQAGQAGLWRGRGRTWRVAVLAIALLAVVAVVVTAALLTDVEEIGAEDPPAVPPPAPVLAPASAEAPVPDGAALSAALDPIAAEPAAGELGAVVVDDVTGEVLWQRDAETPRVPASSTKVLTAMAALIDLPADSTNDTVVGRAANDPDTLVVEPGGDLGMTGADGSELLPDSSSLVDLVGSIRDSGFEPERVVVSNDLYDGPLLAPDWNSADIAGGHITPISPWMLAAGRQDPDVVYSPRSTTPMGDVAGRLAVALGLPASAATIADSEVAMAEEIGRVSSPPVLPRVRAVVENSDNVLAEALCRDVALHRSPESPASFASGTRAVLDVLREQGIDVAGAELEDCSGMSHVNSLTPKVLVDTLRLASAPGAPREWRALLDALPVASATGTLEGRYDGPADSGAGWVRAKTGTLTEINSLVGTVTTHDGRPLSFAFLSEGAPVEEGRTVLDRLAAELRECGCG